jgi:carboxylesterase
LLVALAAACARPGTGAPSPAAAPADYADAVARVERRQAGDDSVVAPGGRSILLTHGRRTPRVFVLLHGFTDSPTQFQAVGTLLFDQGDNVYIPRLPHHAERRSPVRALARVRERELRRFADSVVDEARGLGDSVVVVGLSAGGSIAARIAQSRGEVTRVVLIAPAIGVGIIDDDQGHTLVALASVLPDIHRTSAPDSTRPDFVQGTTSRGLAQVLLLGQGVRDEAEQRASRVRQIVFLLNERDHTVSEGASVDIAQRWFDRGADVKVYRFPAKRGLPHNVMEATERGGNVAIVNPVVVALARATPPPRTVERQSQPSCGLRCTLMRWLRK